MGYAEDEGYYYDPDFVNVKIKRKVHETAKAILFENKVGQFWVPKAVIDYYDDNEVLIDADFDINYLKK